MFCQYKSYSASTSDILPTGVTFCNHVLSKLCICSLTINFDILFCSAVLLCSADSIYPLIPLISGNGEKPKAHLPDAAV